MAWPERKDDCTCDRLQWAVHEPRVPIAFDAKLGEYHLERREEDGYEIVFFCPFCGGRTPESKRDELFQFVSQAEKDRLRETYFDVLHTVDDVRRVLGEPDLEIRQGLWMSPPRLCDEPDAVQTFPSLMYYKLSPMANVSVIVYPSGEVQWSLSAKQIVERNE